MKFGFNRPVRERGFRRVLPFRRSWVAIGILAVMDAVFLFPAITTFSQAAGQWSGLDSLFDLVAALFLSAWLLGWSIAPLLMTGVLVLLLFGREEVRAYPGVVEIFVGLPFIGLTGRYDPGRMRNLRIEKPPPKSSRSWRGSHFIFDYGANEVRVGSDAGSVDLGELESGIRTASGKAVRWGDALPEELEEAWAPSAVSNLMAPASPDAAALGYASKDADAVSTAVAAGGFSTLTVAALIAANLVPVAGTVYLGWDLSNVMVLYWAESAIVGFYNLCKIVMIGRWFALLAGPFFLGHFGGFMAVHFLFVYTIFVKGPAGASDAGNLAEVGRLFLGLWPALLALFLSHGLSFFINFIGRQEYRSRSVKDQMSEPYSRIVFMHLVLIFGGGLVLVLGEATPVLLLVIVVKIAFDVRAHIRERSRGRKTVAAEN